MEGAAAVDAAAEPEAAVKAAAADGAAAAAAVVVAVPAAVPEVGAVLAPRLKRRHRGLHHPVVRLWWSEVRLWSNHRAELPPFFHPNIAEPSRRDAF